MCCCWQVGLIYPNQYIRMSEWNVWVRLFFSGIFLISGLCPSSSSSDAFWDSQPLFFLASCGCSFQPGISCWFFFFSIAYGLWAPPQADGLNALFSSFPQLFQNRCDSCPRHQGFYELIELSLRCAQADCRLP